MAAITKVWVRRPNSSPVRIQIPSSVSSPAFTPSVGGARDTPRDVEVEITDDYLVDDLREAILKKYPQSLGKHHDSADLSIQIPTRRANPDDSDGGVIEGQRILQPDESVIKILTEEYPDGQKSEDAWLIVTSGGRDNYTRWWLQTGGLSTEFAAPFRTALSPNQFIPSAGGSFASGDAHQEYFPYVPVPHAQGSPSGEYPPRSRNSQSSMMSSGQYPRSQGRPPLRQAQTTPHEGFPLRRYDNTSTSSLVVEPISASESDVNLHQHGRASPESNLMPNMRYPPNIRPSSSISGRNTPPAEYPKGLRQYVGQTGLKQPGPTSAPFQMHLPQQPLATHPQKAQSPLGGPPNHPQQTRLSQGSATARPIISTASTSSPITATDKPQIQAKGTTSPKSPGSGSSSNSGQGPPSTSPVTRKKGTTVSGGGLPVIQKPRSPSPVIERTESPLPPRANPLVKAKEKDAVPTKNSIGVIPPINVLIVEDNFINAQILEVFFRKRKLKYATAVNGKEAVEKWRQGGWHLVLMDIQLPVMSGIEATKEIRRLERVNHIGVFTEETTDKPSPEDELGDLPFPSPVIIVALTASSRESDRNEALAAGCNDFLTKPVGAPWLERKAIEWGCMQALIWTSFERKRRRKENLENNSAVDDENEESVLNLGVGEASGEKKKTSERRVSGGEGPEKPPVARGDSGESVQTQGSTSTDEGQQ